MIEKTSRTFVSSCTGCTAPGQAVMSCSAPLCKCQDCGYPHWPPAHAAHSHTSPSSSSSSLTQICPLSLLFLNKRSTFLLAILRDFSFLAYLSPGHQQMIFADVKDMISGDPDPDCMHPLLGWAACKCMISVDQKPGAQERYCRLGAATAAAVTSPACWSPGRQSAKLCEGKNCDYSVSGPAETGHWAAASKVSAGYLWVAALGAAAQGRGGGLVRPGGVDGCLDTP